MEGDMSKSKSKKHSVRQLTAQAHNRQRGDDAFHVASAVLGEGAGGQGPTATAEHVNRVVRSRHGQHIVRQATPHTQLPTRPC